MMWCHSHYLPMPAPTTLSRADRGFFNRSNDLEGFLPRKLIRTLLLTVLNFPFIIQFSVSWVIVSWTSMKRVQWDETKLLIIFFSSLINLQRFIGGRAQNEIDSLVSSKTGGCTPLLIACRNGHYDVVQYLLKRCHADVEQCGSVIFDGETIENGW